MSALHRPPSPASFPPVTSGVCASVIGQALRRAVSPFIRRDKFIAQRTGASIRAVRNWMGEENAPTSAQLITLMREFDEIFDAVLFLSGRLPPDRSDPDPQILIKQALEILERRSNGVNSH